MGFNKEDTINRLESLRRIAGALHNDLTEVLEELKAEDHSAVQTPQEPLTNIEHMDRDAFARPKNTDAMRRKAQEAGHTSNVDTMRNDPKRIEPQPIESAVTELLDQVGEFAVRPTMTPGEILTKYLSPSVLRGGRGFIQPMSNGLRRYKEDLTHHQLETQHLTAFPTGFYAATADSQDQFFVVTPSFLVLVYGLNSTPAVGIRSRSNFGEMLCQHELSHGERLHLTKELEECLSSIAPK